MPWIGEEVEGSAAVHCLKHFAPEVEFHRVAAKQLKIRQAILPGAFRRIAEHRSGKIQADHMTSSETSGEGPCIDSGAAPKVEHEFIALEVSGGRDQGVLALERYTQESGAKEASPPEPTLVHADERWPLHQALGQTTHGMVLAPNDIEFSGERSKPLERRVRPSLLCGLVCRSPGRHTAIPRSAA